MTKRRELYNEETSAWLTVVPMAYHHFDLCHSNLGLTGSEISSTITTIAGSVDACGCQFSTEHALDCRTGGLVIQRHNEIRDA